MKNNQLFLKKSIGNGNYSQKLPNLEGITTTIDSLKFIEWSDYTYNDVSLGHIPNLEEKIWQRKESMPNIGGTYIVKAFFPFNHCIGDVFTIMFCPALLALNDWDDYPEQIELSAITYCRFDSIITKNDFCAWVEISVIDIVPLSTITDSFSLLPYNYALDSFFANIQFLFHLNDNWIYLGWSGEGDLGEWGLIKKSPHGDGHLILYEDWFFADSTSIQCGNIFVPERKITQVFGITPKKTYYIDDIFHTGNITILTGKSDVPLLLKHHSHRAILYINQNLLGEININIKTWDDSNTIDLWTKDDIPLSRTDLVGNTVVLEIL